MNFSLFNKIEDTKIMPPKSSINAVIVTQDSAAYDVLIRTELYNTTWRKQSDQYWLGRLLMEIGELAHYISTNDHSNLLIREQLKRISSISLNWLDKRKTEGR